MENSTSHSSSASQSKDCTEELIQFYRDIACLWQVTNLQYKSRYERDNAIRDIAQKLHLTSKDVKRRINNLRTTYQQCRRRISKRKTGSEAEDTQPIKWKCFTSLELLSDGVLPRDSRSNFDTVCL